MSSLPTSGSGTELGQLSLAAPVSFSAKWVKNGPKMVGGFNKIMYVKFLSPCLVCSYFLFQMQIFIVEQKLPVCKRRRKF